MNTLIVECGCGAKMRMRTIIGVPRPAEVKCVKCGQPVSTASAALVETPPAAAAPPAPAPGRAPLKASSGAFTIACSGCKRPLMVPDDAAGKMVRCKACNAVTQAVAPTPPTVPPPASDPLAAAAQPPRATPSPPTAAPQPPAMAAPLPTDAPANPAGQLDSASGENARLKTAHAEFVAACLRELAALELQLADAKARLLRLASGSS